jgi:hypothetical protein
VDSILDARGDGHSSVSKSRKTRSLLIASTIAWLAAVLAGLGLLAGYENTPGLAADAPNRWPTTSRLHLAPEHDTLVMLVHPHCPCTRASLGELASIMAHSQGRLTAFVLFLKPDGFSRDWEKTDLWRTAQGIPGVTAVLDEDGHEAQLFHAATSGQTLLYNVEGRLLFKGGITSSRGHSGDNAGRGAITSLVNAGAPEHTETAVFGCPLFNPNSECHKPRDEK